MFVRAPLVCLLWIAACALDCSRRAEPGVAGAAAASASASAASAAPLAAATTQRQRPARDGDNPPLPTRPPPDNAPRIRLSHILVAYQGAAGAQPSVTRSKAAAQALAEHVDVQARAGADFAELADKYSDDASVKRNHGDLGLFTRVEAEQVPAAAAAFGLIKQEVAVQPLETAIGFQIIKRTE